MRIIVKNKSKYAPHGNLLAPGPLRDVISQNGIIFHLQHEANRWRIAAGDYGRICIEQDTLGYIRTLPPVYVLDAYKLYDCLKT